MRDKPQTGGRVIPCKVTVQEVPGGYQASYDPPVIPVKHHNSTVRFQLEMPTPNDVVVESVQIAPLGQTQLSNPDISSNGKQVDIFDINTVKETFYLTFTFKNKKGERLSLKMAPLEAGGDDNYPHIDNDPPG